MDKLCRLPVNELQSYVTKTVGECAVGGGYALGSGNSIPNFIDIQNYETMLKVGLKHGKYPK